MPSWSARRSMKRTDPIEWDDVVWDTLNGTRWFKPLMRHAHQRCIDVCFEDGPRAASRFDTTACTPKTDDEEEGDPRIVIACREWAVVVDDVADTSTLAHELGHHESWLRRECANEVYAMLYDDLANEPRELRQATLDEEERAW